MGGGGGAIDTESTAEKRQREREQQRKESQSVTKNIQKTVKRVHPDPKQTLTQTHCRNCELVHV